MLLSSTCSNLLRTLSVIPKGQYRQLAVATVKKASDTSGLEFAAPSHVSLSTQVAEIAQDISNFYTSPDSKVDLPPKLKMELKDEIEKKTRSMITEMDDIDVSQLQVEIPDQMHISENPMFEVYKQSRSAKTT